MVSSEENGKSKKCRTYRDLESLKARKEQTEKLNKVSVVPSLSLATPHCSEPHCVSYRTVGMAIWNTAPK